jgi:hypothetical protein
MGTAWSARTLGSIRQVTGWQGNEGGGWNPQQNPYGGGGQQGGPYGGDPYAGQYGADPYPGQQYGVDPNAGHPYDPYGGYGQTSPYPDFSPPPPKRSKLPIVLSIIAIAAVVGTVVTIVLLNRDSPEPSATAGTTSSSRAAPTSRSTPPSSRRPPPSSGAPSGRDGWITVELAGGSYQVPPDWKKSAETRASGLGVDFAGGAVIGEYNCGGAVYWRGFTATGEVQGKDGATLELNKTVTDFAKSFAGQFYRDPKIDVPNPKPTTVNGKDAVLLTAKLTVAPGNPECDATSGEVAVVGVKIEQDGKPAGVRMLVVVNDLAGGPAKPAAVPDPVAEEILGTLTLR